MIKLAILGATSQIAKDLIIAFSKDGGFNLSLFARRPEAVTQWSNSIGLSNRHEIANFDCFTTEKKFDVVLNCVGVSNPTKMKEVGASIFNITLKYDQMALDYLNRHPLCRYIFLSSGAAYGSNFEYPVDENSNSLLAINKLQPQDWYAIAKLHAECRHRSLFSLPIVDIRVFNYFSHTQDISTRFLITDIVRAILNQTVLKTSIDDIVRDFIHPSDFYNLVIALLKAPAENAVVDCYSKAPIAKSVLLKTMQEHFGLNYEINKDASMNTTGIKPHYYSLNKRAADFGYTPYLSSIEGILEESQIIQEHFRCK